MQIKVRLSQRHTQNREREKQEVGYDRDTSNR